MKLRLTHLAAVVLVLGLAAGVYIAFFAYPELQKKRAEMDAVERYLKNSHLSPLYAIDTHAAGKECFMSIRGEDPSDEFLNRFMGGPVILRKFSDYEGRGTILQVDEIRWECENRIGIHGRLSSGVPPVLRTSFAASMEANDAEWSVKSSDMKAE